MKVSRETYRFRINELKYLLLDCLTDFIWVSYLDIVTMAEMVDDRVDAGCVSKTLNTLARQGYIERKSLIGVERYRWQEKYLYKLAKKKGPP